MQTRKQRTLLSVPLPFCDPLGGVSLCRNGNLGECGICIVVPQRAPRVSDCGKLSPDIRPRIPVMVSHLWGRRFDLKRGCLGGLTDVGPQRTPQSDSNPRPIIHSFQSSLDICIQKTKQSEGLSFFPPPHLRRPPSQCDDHAVRLHTNARVEKVLWHTFIALP